MLEHQVKKFANVNRISQVTKVGQFLTNSKQYDLHTKNLAAAPATTTLLFRFFSGNAPPAFIPLCCRGGRRAARVSVIENVKACRHPEAAAAEGPLWPPFLRSRGKGPGDGGLLPPNPPLFS